MEFSGGFEPADPDDASAGPKMLVDVLSPQWKEHDPAAGWDGRGGAAVVVAEQPQDVVLQQPSGIGADGKVTERTWMASRQPFAGSAFKLLAVDPAEITQKDPNRPLAGVLTLPSGVRVLAAGHVSAPYGNGEGGPHSRLDIAQLLPTGDDSALALAWQSYRDTDGGRSNQVIQTAALGPLGTVTVEWTGPGGASTSAASSTLASTARTDIESVRFLDGSGAELGRAEVRQPKAAEFSMREEGYRFESRPAWLLPEVKEALAGY